MLTTIHLVVSLGMLVVIPLGLRLLRLPRAGYWWLAAIPGAGSLWLDRGWLPTAMASIYFAGTLVLVAVAVRRRPRAARDIAICTALVTPSIAGLSLVAERAGYQLFGFKLTVLSLTVAHFHFAGFAAALIAGLVATASPGRDASLAAVSVPLGTGIVLTGFFLGDAVELLGAAVLTTGMWLVGWVLWRRTRASTAHRLTRTLLATAAGVLVATMLLALSWALGHVAGTPYLPLEWMVATHGVANAFGFALCGLLAWHRLRREGTE